MYDGERQLFIEVQEGYKVFCVKRYEHFVHLLGGQYLFEILHTSPTVKSSKNVVKSVSKNCGDGERYFFLKWRRRIIFFFFFVKIFARLIIVKEDANTLIFHIFQCGAENVAECSAESGAK